MCRDKLIRLPAVFCRGPSTVEIFISNKPLCLKGQGKG